MESVDPTNIDERREMDFHDWVNEQIRSNNLQINNLQNSANSASDKLGDQLLAVASAIIAVVAGFIFISSSTLILSPAQKTAVTLMIISFATSIVSGLINYHYVSQFWKNIALHVSRETKIFKEEDYTVKDYARLQRRILNHRAETPMNNANNVVAIRLQMLMFTAGLVLLVCLVVVKIYTIKG